MRRFLPRLAIACAAFLAGSLTGSIHKHLVTKPPAREAAPNAPAPPPAAVTSSIDTEVSYPEDEGLNPRHIEYFINRNPRANLTRLSERLGLRDEESGSFEWHCNNCTAQRFHYNLDDDRYKEILLRIAQPMSEYYVYLIFKERAYDDTQLLGSIGVWSKYRPSSHAMLLSAGKSWLVIDGQSASGSGLAAYHHTIYQVSSRDVKPVLSYLSEIHQSGFAHRPTRTVVGRPVSIEVQNGRVKGTVAYTVAYFSNGRDGVPLFEKRQTAVLVGSYAKGWPRLDATASDITPHEFETVFNFDSLFEEEFLQYNRSELRAIAIGRDRPKKAWLKECLATFENSRIKRELMSLLR